MPIRCCVTNTTGNTEDPASWIDAATSPHIMGPGVFFYGYQFWLGRSFVNQREVLWASAVGLGGQRIYVVPDLDLVVVVNAGCTQARSKTTLRWRYSIDTRWPR
jgi:CubicO group peptidase (beta-lactamase class C family)